MKLQTIVWLTLVTILTTEASYAVDLSVPPARQDAEATVEPKEEIILSAKVTNALTLDKAIQKAIDNSPRLKSANSAKSIIAGEQEQAGVMPNPEISVEAENVAGSGNYKGIDSGEITYGVSQLIEIGGKRDARIGIADKGMTLAELDLQAERLNLIRDITIAYAEAVAAQEQVKLAKEQKKLSTEVLQTVTKRVNAAADPLYQKSKAEVADLTNDITLDKAERDLITAKQKLSVLWGENRSNFELNTTKFFDISEPQELGNLNDRIKRNPDYQRWDTELERKNAAVDLEEANAIPDPSINVGVRDLREDDEQAFVLGVSLPIPVFNSNSGNISRARAESLKTETDKIEARNQLTSQLNSNWHELQNSYKQAEILKNKIIPSAQESFKLARYGHDIGKFPYLEVLDAQRTLFNSREQYNESLKQYHITKAEVERLTAKNLLISEVTNEKE